jgi:hypothetical protein
MLYYLLSATVFILLSKILMAFLHSRTNYSFFLLRLLCLNSSYTLEIKSILSSIIMSGAAESSDRVPAQPDLTADDVRVIRVLSP